MKKSPQKSGAIGNCCGLRRGLDSVIGMLPFWQEASSARWKRWFDLLIFGLRQLEAVSKWIVDDRP